MPREQHALEVAARLITARAEPEEVLDAVLNACLDSTKATRALIALIDRRNGELVISCVAGKGWTDEKMRVRLGAGSGVHEGIIGLVATTGHAYRTGDVADDPYYYRLFDDARSELAVPLIRSGERIRGVLNLESGEPDAFSEADEHMVSALAALASVGVSMAEHHRREHALAQVAQRLNHWGETAEQLKEFTEAAADILQAFDGSLFLLSPDKHTLVLAASEGPLRDQVGQAVYEVGEGLTGTVAEHGHPVRLEDVASDPHWVGKHQEVSQERIAGFLAVPVMDENARIQGVLRVIRDKTPNSLRNPFTENDQTILSTLASQVAVLLRRQRLLKRLVQSERLGAWGQLSARAAHIIGNKVFAIKGAVGELRFLFEDEPGCRQDCRELLETMTRSLSEIDDIVQSFKDFVAARDQERVPVDVNRLLAAEVKKARGAARGVEFALEPGANLPEIMADASQLGECFAELIQNAVAWQPDGGEVRISTSVARSDEAWEVADVGRAAEYVRVDLEDAGPGVAPERKQEIFEPFVSTRGRGLGLGLSICREVVRAQGGEIVEIGEPPGAHFVVFLPVAEK